MLTLSVLLRQNPHNVHEWLKRVKLFEGKPREVSTSVVTNWSVHIGTVTPTLAVHPSPSHTLTLPLSQIINTYTEAVQTVDIDQAVGKPHTLWVNFAKFYEENDQLPEVWRL